MNKILFKLKPNQKIPDTKGWQKLTVTQLDKYDLFDFDIGLTDYNVGWVLQNDDLIIDVDVKKGGKGLESLKKLINDFPFLKNIKPNVKTPTGGYHYYFKKPEDVIINMNHNDYPNIDFLSKGRFVVTINSTIDGVRYERYSRKDCNGLIDKSLLDKITKKYDNDIVHAEIINEQEDLELFQMVNQLEESEVIEMINSDAFDPDCDYQTWLNVGMALHDWNTNKGYDIFNEWSSLSDMYDEDEINSKWESFSLKYNGNISIGYIVDTYKRHNINKKVEEFKSINDKDVFNEKLKEFSSVTGDSKKYIDVAIQEIKPIFKESFNETLTIMPVKQEIKKEIENKKVQDFNSGNANLNSNDYEKLRHIIKEKYPHIFKTYFEYVKINSNNKYVNINNPTETIAPDSFKTILLSKRVQDVIKPEIRRLLDVNNIVEAGFALNLHVNVANTMYMPNKNLIDSPFSNNKSSELNTSNFVDSDIYSNIDNRNTELMYLNTYVKPKHEVKTGEYPQEVLDYIKFLNNHILKLFNYDKYQASLFLDWICHNIQKPGKKIPFVPLIEGEQGTGKTFIGSLLKSQMGFSNVKDIESSNIASDFNGWSADGCVGIFEEIRVNDVRDKYSMMNKLKPLITNETIQVTRKHNDPVNILNTMNYLAFTNHSGSIVIEASDRRWWYTKSECDPLTIHEDSGFNSSHDYFTYLFSGLRGDMVSWLNKYLSDKQISKEFLELNRAPNTKSKQNEIDNQLTNSHPHYESIVNIINSGKFKNINKDFICYSDFKELVTILNRGYKHINDMQNIALLKNLGYIKHFSRGIMIKGLLYNFYVKKEILIDNDDSTIKSNIKDLVNKCKDYPKISQKCEIHEILTNMDDSNDDNDGNDVNDGTKLSKMFEDVDSNDNDFIGDELSRMFETKEQYTNLEIELADLIGETVEEFVAKKNKIHKKE